MTSEVTVPNISLELQSLSATICAELAAGLADANAIKEKYEISPEQWTLLANSQAFRRMLAEAIERWSGDMNAGARITVKSEIALEDSIPVLYQIAHNSEAPTASRIDSIKTMAQLAGRNNKEANAPGSSGNGFAVNIHINTGGEEKPVVAAIEGEKG